MKIERFNENKLKFTFSIKDLEKINIAYDEFMAGSPQSQNMILDLLHIAKDNFDFDIKDCDVEVEILEIGAR